MHAVSFKQVDVFTREPFMGNPVAVILDAEGLDGEQMQRIARWTNLSETAFVLPPSTQEASYRVRIFTPRQELPFAGHPSVGTAHAVLDAGLASPVDGALIQECAAGLLPVRVDGIGPDRVIHVRAPEAKFEAVVDGDAQLLAGALGGRPQDRPAPQVVDNGPRWWVVGFSHASAVEALVPDMGALAELTLQRGAVGVAAYGATGAADPALVVRCFCPADGIPEDPVTGSGNAAIAAFLQRHGALPAANYIASQGRQMQRNGYVAIRAATDGIHLGGHSVTVLDGLIRLD